MSGWTTQHGQVICLPTDNIDTDQIIPARFMSQPRVDGYAEFLLYDLRRDDKGAVNPDFILNQHPSATCLLAGKNFGSGSSREAAVYALLDSGIRVVIAESFGDIFAANAINNGVLPAQVSTQHWELLHQAMSTPVMDYNVDLETATIGLGEHRVAFAIDDTWRLKLINGWDDTDLTGQHQAKINAYRKFRYKQNAWAWPTTNS